jgi:UDP-N-acetyl-D-mannosaminuronate dehydrogenase
VWLETGSGLVAVEAFYRGIVATTVAVSSPREAELAKLIENTFRHVNIALVNELAMFGRELGVDVWEAIDAAATKPFGYMRFSPGPGVGVAELLVRMGAEVREIPAARPVSVSFDYVVYSSSV